MAHEESGKKTHMIDLSHKKEDYTHHPRKATRILYTLFLLVLSVCNFLIFLALIPLMLFVQSPLLILIMGAVGLLFGLIFSFMVKDIEYLQPRHHLLAAFLIPLLSLINIFVLVSIAQFVQGESSYPRSIMLVASLVYTIMFLLPYAVEYLLEGRMAKSGRNSKL